MSRGGIEGFEWVVLEIDVNEGKIGVCKLLGDGKYTATAWQFCTVNFVNYCNEPGVQKSAIYIYVYNAHLRSG